MSKNKDMPRFIAFEGSDGCGKTTQLNIFANLLREKGYNGAVHKGLGGDGKDFVQNEMRKLLLSPEFPADDMETEEKLFAIADSRNLRSVKKFLEESNSNIVINDRGVATHIVYALAKNIDPNDLYSYHADMYELYDDLAVQFGGLNVILIPEDEKLAMERVVARGITVTPRLENLDMQKAVIAGMKRVDRPDTLEGSFMPETYSNVTLEVTRTESIPEVTAKIVAALRAAGYGV